MNGSIVEFSDSNEHVVVVVVVVDTDETVLIMKTRIGLES